MRHYAFASICNVVLLLILSNLLHAQTPSPTVTPTPVSQIQADAEKVAVLQGQLELMRQYDQRLLSTVYWSLGGLGGVVLLVVGLGWYTNFRIYKRDVEDIKRDIKNELESTAVSFKREMMDAAKNAGDAAVRSALRDVKELQYQMLKVDAERWENSGIHANALYACARRLPLAKDLLTDIYIPQTLEEMLRILKTKEVILNAHVTAEINKSLDIIPKEFSTDADAIRQMIRSLRSKSDRT